MTITARVNVTEDDIRNGGHGPLNCPIALAIKRIAELPKGYVRGTSIDWYEKSESFLTPEQKPHHRTSLPFFACLFISQFDNGRDVKPFTFELEI